MVKETGQKTAYKGLKGWFTMKDMMILAVVILIMVIASASLIFVESKRQTCSSDNPVIRLAYLHHFIYPIFLSTLIITRHHRMAGIGFILFSAWTFFGYLLRWKHIYCSHQISAHEPMTPSTIWWSDIETAEAYGIPVIFLICGIGSIVASFLM